MTVYTWDSQILNWSRRLYNTNASISALVSLFLPGDQRLDLIGIGASGLVALESDPNPLFGFQTPSAHNAGTPSEPFRISSGDYNRDGFADVIILNAAEDSIALIVGRPEGGFFDPDLIPTTRTPLSFAEGALWVSNDDIVITNMDIPGIMFLLNESDL